MQRTLYGTAGLALLLALVPLPARAEMIEEVGRFGGLDVRYKVVLPNDYDAARTYPLALHLVGGPQTMEIVESSLNADWRHLAETQGMIVVSPASPNGELFFSGADVIFPEFLDFLLTTYHPAGGKMHITGHSNGGISAFHVASLYPDYFLSVTGYPGLLNAQERLDALEGLCIFMHVGDQDTGWLGAMQEQAQTLEQRGYEVSFTIETDQIHRLDTSRGDLAQRLFDELASARDAGCS